MIQYAYDRYGRTHAAQVATVVTYRARSAVRDAARALGYAPGAHDAWGKSLDRWGPVAAALAEPDQPIPGGSWRSRSSFNPCRDTSGCTRAEW